MSAAGAHRDENSVIKRMLLLQTPSIRHKKCVFIGASKNNYFYKKIEAA